MQPVRRSLLPLRWGLPLALGGLSLSAVALGTPFGSQLVQRWVLPTVRVLSIDSLIRDWDQDEPRVVTAPSAFTRLMGAVSRAKPLLLSAPDNTAANTASASLQTPSGASDSAAPDVGTISEAAASASATPTISMGTGGRLPPQQILQTAALKTDISYVDGKSSAYASFKSYVDQAVAGRPDWGFAASDSVLMYQITGQQKYCDLAVKMVENQVSSAEARIASGSAPDVAGDSYLDSGAMIQDLSTTYVTCRASLSSSQLSRWSAYAEQTIWNIWNYKSAKWGSKTIPWSGWSTSDPGDNYYYSFIDATMHWALASGSQTWMDLLNKTKLPLLTSYFASLPGGGSLEGTGYGTSHMNLFADYMIWRSSTGVDLANANSHATDSIRYWINATVPTLDRFAPYGDQARTSVPVMYDYQRRLVLEARYLTADQATADLASWWLKHISIKQMSNSFNRRWDMLPVGTANTAPSDLIYVAPGVGQMFARTDWGTSAMWVSFIAGKYNQSHAHQEQGAFTLFSGDWLAVTENIWTQSGIQQGTSLNNILRFDKNGSAVPQVANTTSTMSVSPGAGGAFSATTNLKPAYGGNSAVGAWTRQLAFADRTLTVTDDFSVGSGTTATFQINVPVQPSVSGTSITAGKLKVRVTSPANPTIKLVDWKSSGGSDYQKGWRIDISGSSSRYVVSLSDH